MDAESSFQKELVQYLESVHMGEFFDNKHASEVITEIDDHKARAGETYVPATDSLPVPAPRRCKESHGEGQTDQCEDCANTISWWSRFKTTVNELVWRVHWHDCGSQCLTRKNGTATCKARYPRETRQETTVDPETGYLNLRKGEAKVNTFSPALTYVLRSNTDVTSLLSGTAIKAVIAYVTDYVTKPQLQTHVLFDIVRSVLKGDPEIDGATAAERLTARQLIVKMVNALSSKSSVGAPMASTYLLELPDVYRSHVIATVYWYQFVRYVKDVWNVHDMEEDPNADKVMISNVEDSIVQVDHVQDYALRPAECHSMSLWDWWRRSAKMRSSTLMVRNRPRPRERSTAELVNEDQVMTGKPREDDTIESNRLMTDVSASSSPTMVDSDDSTASDTDVVMTESGTPEAPTLKVHHKRSRSEYDPEDSVGPSEDGMNALLFLDIHTQYMSHHVNVKPESHDVVLNLSGSTLPRRDMGNLEEYYMTMLTFFKPWRRPEDLKKLDQTWREAFDEHQWSTRALKAMKNMHIKYECNDARDDYNA